MYTDLEVREALAAYHSRPHTSKGRAADLEAEGPRMFAGIRNIELVVEPHINAPLRGFQIFELDEPPNDALLPELLPILAAAARQPPAPAQAPVSPRRFAGNADEVLDRLAGQTITDEEILGWLRNVAYHLEAYTNSHHPSVVVALGDPRLDVVRAELERGLAAALRPIARNALLKLLADGHPG